MTTLLSPRSQLSYIVFCCDDRATPKEVVVCLQQAFKVQSALNATTANGESRYQADSYCVTMQFRPHYMNNRNVRPKKFSKTSHFRFSGILFPADIVAANFPGPSRTTSRGQRMIYWSVWTQ